MFLSLLIFMFFGISLGVVTGLIPGLHPNTLFIIILSFSGFVASFPAPCILVFIISAALCNTFTNFIPSILFGAPEPGSCLSVLPGHRLLMQGNGYEAVFLTVAGGIGAAVFILLSFPLLIVAVPFLYSIMHNCIHVILIFISIWMMLNERKRIPAFLVFMLAGIFGFISLNSMPSGAVLFPALTGLFGMSTLITSIMSRTTIPPQQGPSGTVCNSKLSGSLAGWLAGMLTGLLPGVGAAHAGLIVAQTFRAKTRDFLTALGGINTSNVFFTFIVFYAIGKTRSGAAWAVSQLMETISIGDIILLAFAGTVACFLSAMITLKMAGFLTRRISSFDYNRVNAAILLLLLVLVYVFSGPVGIMVSLIGTCIGLTAILSGTRRTHLMGFLILPTILYFSGLNAILLFAAGL